MKQVIFIVLFLLCCNPLARASHIVGGEIYYDYLGNNKYHISIAMYRDCNSTGAAYDDPLYMVVYNDGHLVTTIQFPFGQSVHIPLVFNNPCVTAPGGICVERYVYEQTITLPPTANGYTIAYQRCCRGPNVMNIVNPDDTGFTLNTHINGTESPAFHNSTPRFTNYPPFVLCNNDNLIFDHSATDPDGDSLVYEMTNPYAGANSDHPQPSNPDLGNNPDTPGPPYAPVHWESGFSATQPLGPGSSVTIDRHTGRLVADADLLGIFVVGIRVREFRNGVEIGHTDIDFLFRVINCVIQLEAIITPQNKLPGFVDYCQGTTVNFGNESYGGDIYKWDFGVAGITSDVSSATTPSYTFPGPGTYTVQLIVNPGYPCTDTSTEVFIVHENLVISYVPPSPQCQRGNSFDFDGSLTGPPGTVIAWDFTPGASPPTASTVDVNNVSYATFGTFNVVMKATFQDICERVETHPLIVYEQPIAGFDPPPKVECVGYTVPFTNTSIAATTYAWDFGESGTTADVSTVTDPTYTYGGSGNYDVLLVASGGDGTCKDSVIHSIRVDEKMIVSISSADSMCITGNSFDFTGSYTGPGGSVFDWDFGPFASIHTATGLTVDDVSFNAPGRQTVRFRAQRSICEATDFKTVYLYREPTINFGLVPANQCEPFTAQFVDSSSSETSIEYNWDFGDGTPHSSESNPLHVYPDPGLYDVSLEIKTYHGCIADLTLNKPDMIEVFPKPVAGFKVTPLLTDVCGLPVVILDQSIGAVTYKYYLDEYGLVDTTANPRYFYETDGTKNIVQIVENGHQCLDTARGVVLVEPAAVYAPNTFTPDGDKYNNEFNAVTAFLMKEWQLTIYNRWGELVFESYDQSKGWDGKYGNGEMAPDGNYTYIIKYIDCERKALRQTVEGHVNLLR